MTAKQAGKDPVTATREAVMNEGFPVNYPYVTVPATYDYILAPVGYKAVLRHLPGTRYLINIYHEIYEGVSATCLIALLTSLMCTNTELWCHGNAYGGVN